MINAASRKSVNSKPSRTSHLIVQCQRLGTSKSHEQISMNIGMSCMANPKAVNIGDPLSCVAFADVNFLVSLLHTHTTPARQRSRP